MSMTAEELFFAGQRVRNCLGQRLVACLEYRMGREHWDGNRYNGLITTMFEGLEDRHYMHASQCH